MSNEFGISLKLEDSWEVVQDIEKDKELESELELDKLLVDISLKFINYRIDNNLTQKQLAEKLGISQSMVSKLESGEYNPTIGQLFKLSKKIGWTFNITIEEQMEEFNDWQENSEEVTISICQSIEDEYGECA